MIRVLVVDDHQLVRSGTARLLSDMDGIEIVGDADSGENAIKMVRELRPDVVLMDVQMPGIGGLEATRRCLRVDPDLKIIAVTIHDQEPFPSQLMKIGASGYLTKKADVHEMAKAIKKVMAGQRYISAEIAQQLALAPYSEADNQVFASLSKREMQIVLMTVNGLGPSEIADLLNLSPKTVSSYRHRIFEKLEIKNDIGLMKLAIQYGIIDLDSAAGSS